jgi:hypothetical protein
VPQAELACGRVGDDVDVMAVQPERPALRLLSGLAACMTASWCICMARESFPHAFWWWCSRPGLTPLVMAHTPVGPGGGRVRRRLLVRGGDFSCEVETSRGDPSCRELVEDAANWSET